jgi:DNA-binding beta-propeller fold protein YncE
MMTTHAWFAAQSLGRRAAIVLVCAATVVPLAASGQWKKHHRERDTIWVANRDQGTVMVFDAATGKPAISSPIDVGPGAHDIVASPRTATVFVSDDASRVYVVSTTTRRVVETIEFSAGSRPHHLSLSHDGKTVWVGLFSSNRIAGIDTRTHAVREFASSLQSGVTAHAPEPSPDDRFIFVPHEGQNLVTKLSARRETVRGEASPGPTATSSPSEVLPTRDGRTLFVSMRNEDTVRTIDLDTFRPTRDVAFVGDQPESLILTPGERTLIVSLRGTPARLAFVDTDPLELEGTLDVAGDGTFGDLAVAAPDGRFVYMTFDLTAGGQGGVAKVDVRRRAVVDTFLYPGDGRPHGITYVAGRSRR